MFQAVRRLAKVKPVYVSMGSVAASGGYYVACGGTSIWANPASLTGSIGVKLQLTDMQELMSKIGIREQTITSGELKNTGTIFRPLTEEERAYMQQLVDDIHDQFLSDIALSRDMTREEIEPLADGRAMTGRQAVQAGLVDNLGGFEDVVEALERDLGLESGVELVEGPEESEGFLSRILGLAHEAYVGFIPRHLLRPALSEISIQDAQQ
jgi:protease-4